MKQTCYIIFINVKDGICENQIGLMQLLVHRSKGIPLANNVRYSEILKILSRYCFKVTYTRWYAIAWEKFCSDPKFILKCARQVAYANCRCGCQNELVTLNRISTYKVPGIDEPPMDPYTKEEAQAMALAERLRRKEKRKEKRRARHSA